MSCCLVRGFDDVADESEGEFLGSTSISLVMVLLAFHKPD